MRLEELGLQTKSIKVFAAKGIRTTDDAALTCPRAYRDYRQTVPAEEADLNRYAAFEGKLTYCDRRYGKRSYIVARMEQANHTTVSFMLFSETFRFNEYRTYLGKQVVVFGKASHDPKFGWGIKYAYGLCLRDRFVPGIRSVYPQIRGVSDEMFRRVAEDSIACAEEPLPERIVREYRLLPYREALEKLHRPETRDDIAAAKCRLLVNDLVYYSAALGMSEKRGTEDSPMVFRDHALARKFLSTLPYRLTEDQMKCLNTVVVQASHGKRANVLIQGDVGCGKTAVAFALMAEACGNGYQAVLAAPREVLARQHFDEAQRLLAPLGLKCVFLRSGMKGKERKEAMEGLKDGSIHLAVGTHSCLSEEVVYHRLGLAVIDEEHLFGVRQKEAIEAKAGKGIHTVSMSATPIPRSLASVVYGTKKTVLSIRTMPPGRLPVKTAVQASHKNVFPFMEKEIAKGHRCYVVCPAIEESESAGLVAIETVEGQYRAWFEPRNIRVGVVNGRMERSEIAETVRAFVEGEISVLISTTVIEVGVNVPSATVMVVEQAERFGLASLHQLRGRVGRSSDQSYCILLSNDRGNPRLQAMVRTTDGFEIAEADLAQRGGGDLLGIRQAGRNRYIEEMLRYPGVFETALRISRGAEDPEKEFAKLFEIYRDREEAPEEE